MLVYGDQERRISPAERLGAVEECLRKRSREALTDAFILASELAQGLIDDEFGARGEDDITPLHEAALRFLLDIARRIVEPAEAVPALSHALASLPLPESVTVRSAEGYAHYALYPEAYLAAGSRLGGPATVIGLRSIGTGLGALVAAASGSDRLFSLRPVGEPFDRRLSVARALEDALLAGRGGTFAIVDEGPGLSGSSFGSVADWLAARGVAREAIIFFPSHGGDPGAAANPVRRAHWRKARRLNVDFDALFVVSESLTGSSLPRHPEEPAERASRRTHNAGACFETRAAPAPQDDAGGVSCSRSGSQDEEGVSLRPAPEAGEPLATWFEDLVGPAAAPIRDLSGGAWRDLRGDAPDRPPAHTGQERRKFLLHAQKGVFLLKFAGLGPEPRRKLARARALHAAGFSPEPLALRRGMLLERWVSGEPLAADRSGKLVPRLGTYLGFRAASFPERQAGASLRDLLAMAEQNIAEACGPAEARAALDGLSGDRVEALQSQVRPVSVDGRLHPWEWLKVDGRYLKTDALDHAEGHDLVGPQDIAWDVAGARVEFCLHEDGLRSLLAAMPLHLRPSRELIELLTPCYLGFQIGLWTFAAQSDPDGGRPAALIARYVRYLRSHALADGRRLHA